jgi:hypothetical protein
VLLHCGDHDSGGLHISDFLRSNLADVSVATADWENRNNPDIDYLSREPWDPANLHIDRAQPPRADLVNFVAQVGRANKRGPVADAVKPRPGDAASRPD